MICWGRNTNSILQNRNGGLQRSHDHVWKTSRAERVFCFHHIVLSSPKLFVGWSWLSCSLHFPFCFYMMTVGTTYFDTSRRSFVELCNISIFKKEWFITLLQNHYTYARLSLRGENLLKPCIFWRQQIRRSEDPQCIFCCTVKWWVMESVLANMYQMLLALLLPFSPQLERTFFAVLSATISVSGHICVNTQITSKRRESLFAYICLHSIFYKTLLSTSLSIWLCFCFRWCLPLFQISYSKKGLNCFFYLFEQKVASHLHSRCNRIEPNFSTVFSTICSLAGGWQGVTANSNSDKWNNWIAFPLWPPIPPLCKNAHTKGRRVSWIHP